MSEDMFSIFESNEELKGHMKELGRKKGELVDVMILIMRDIERLVELGGNKRDIDKLSTIIESVIEMTIKGIMQELNERC